MQPYIKNCFPDSYYIALLGPNELPEKDRNFFLTCLIFKAVNVTLEL
jgi:hypothetical protein